MAKLSIVDRIDEMNMRTYGTKNPGMLVEKKPTVVIPSKDDWAQIAKSVSAGDWKDIVITSGFRGKEFEKERLSKFDPTSGTATTHTAEKAIDLRVLEEAKRSLIGMDHTNEAIRYTLEKMYDKGVADALGAPQAASAPSELGSVSNPLCGSW